MVEKKVCTGCMVCADVCPQRCITVIKDKEGFSYPTIISKSCVHCGLCDKVCPVKMENDSLKDKSKFFAVKNLDKEIQINSSSGGVFSALAEYILSENGLVVGGGWKENTVVPVEIKGLGNLSVLRGSKYVQSNNIGIYRDIKKKLKQGERILFSGMPCQANALASYVGDSLRSNLYLIELVCHGVPSPAIWEKYIQLLCNKLNKKENNIQEMKFKYKDEVKFFWNHPGFRILWSDGSEYVEYSNKTWYENGYLGNLYVRPACHNCHFKNLKTNADITIGDFWGCKQFYPDFYDANGVSVVAINSLKGQELFERVQNKLSVISISLEEATKYNQRFVVSSKVSKKRKRFWKEYDRLSNTKCFDYEQMETLVNDCLKIPLHAKFLHVVRSDLGKIKRKLVRSTK